MATRQSSLSCIINPLFLLALPYYCINSYFSYFQKQNKFPARRLLCVLLSIKQNNSKENYPQSLFTFFSSIISWSHLIRFTPHFIKTTLIKVTNYLSMLLYLTSILNLSMTQPTSNIWVSRLPPSLGHSSFDFLPDTTLSWFFSYFSTCCFSIPFVGFFPFLQSLNIVVSGGSALDPSHSFGDFTNVSPWITTTFWWSSDLYLQFRMLRIIFNSILNISSPFIK